MVMWYSLQQTDELPVRRGLKRNPQRPFQPISDFFGIWHEYKRGETHRVPFFVVAVGGWRHKYRRGETCRLRGMTYAKLACVVIL